MTLDFKINARGLFDRFCMVLSLMIAFTAIAAPTQAVKPALSVQLIDKAITLMLVLQNVLLNKHKENAYIPGNWFYRKSKLPSYFVLTELQKTTQLPEQINQT